MMWWIFTSSLWKSSLGGLASSHVLRLTLLGVPKIPLYCTEYNWPTTLTPTNEESSWAQWGKNLIGKNNLSIEFSEVNVWLLWILTTNCKSLKRVETCQKKHFNFWLFFYVNLFFRINLQTVFTLWIYIYIFLICSALNRWLFIFIWMMLFWSRVWKDT